MKGETKALIINAIIKRENISELEGYLGSVMQIFGKLNMLIVEPM